MQLQTPVIIQQAPFSISPMESMLFVGSCFADNIGRLFVEDKFRATVNPFGVMYNPASILHTVVRHLLTMMLPALPSSRSAPTTSTSSTRRVR